MKTLFKMLPALALILLSASCLAQKQVASDAAQTKEVVSEVLYDQAIKALDDHQFIIRVDQLYFPYGRNKSTTLHNGYISMQGSKAIIALEHSVRGINPFVKDDVAEMTNGKIKRNGDTKYTLTMADSQTHFSKDIIVMLITVYKGSNKCSVRIDRLTRELVTIDGHISPLQEGDIVD